MGGGGGGGAKREGVGGPPEAGRPSLGGQAHIRVEHEVKLGDFTLQRRAGVVGGEEGRVAAGRDSAGEDSGDIGDGSGEIGRLKPQLLRKNGQREGRRYVSRGKGQKQIPHTARKMRERPA